MRARQSASVNEHSIRIIYSRNCSHEVPQQIEYRPISVGVNVVELEGRTMGLLLV